MGQGRQVRRAILIVEDDAELRHLAAALFEDENMDTITCETAEAALATMLIRGREVAMIFAEIQLPGAMDGVDLASEVKIRWPLLPVVLTSGHARERVGDLPPGVDYMPKPWQPLNVLAIGVPWGDPRASLTSATADQPLEVVSARPLSDEEIEHVGRALKEALGSEIAFKCRGNPHLVAGIELHSHNTTCATVGERTSIGSARS